VVPSRRCVPTASFVPNDLFVTWMLCIAATYQSIA
jgi:hypothetical protein